MNKLEQNKNDILQRKFVIIVKKVTNKDSEKISEYFEQTNIKRET